MYMWSILNIQAQINILFTIRWFICALAFTSKRRLGRGFENKQMSSEE